jgi:hypothetical protein
MYDIFVRLEAFHSQNLDFPSHAEFRIRVELNIILECQPLCHEVVVDEIVDAAREELNADFKVACILGAEGEGFGRETMCWDVL